MNYGLSYKGSKSRIAKWIVEALPSADVWVEPFAGGCAVTHAAILSGKYKRFIINDITDSAKFFVDTVNGKFKDENRWISREDFFRLKKDDAYVRLCFLSATIREPIATVNRSNHIRRLSTMQSVLVILVCLKIWVSLFRKMCLRSVIHSRTEGMQ